MEELAVGARADLIDHRRLQVDEDASRDMFARASLAEERVERIVATADRLVRRHLAVRLDTVLEAEKLPAPVPDLAAGLAHVNENRLTHCFEAVLRRRKAK